MKRRRSRLKITRHPPDGRTIRVALDRQSKALDRHEAVIAKHTRVQTYVAAVTTIVLAAITFLQYRAGERQVALEYAKVSNQYEVEVIYREPPPTRYGLPVDSFSREYYRLPDKLKFTRTAGLGVIDRIEVDQEFYVLPADEPGIDIPETSCSVWVSFWFAVTDPRQSEFSVSRLANNAAQNVRFKGPAGQALKISAARTSVQVHYRDVFGGKRFDEIIGEGVAFEIIRSEGGWLNTQANQGNLGTWGRDDVPFDMLLARDDRCNGLLTK